MPAGSTSQTVRPVIGTSFELADVPLLVASTRNITESPSPTCTWSVSAGFVGPPFTPATPLVRPTGGAAAIEKSTPLRSDWAVPAELVLRSLTMLPGLSGGGPDAASTTSALNRTANTLPTGTAVEPSPVVAPSCQLS